MPPKFVQATLILNQQFKLLQCGENFRSYVTDKSKRKNQRKYINNKPGTEM